MELASNFSFIQVVSHEKFRNKYPGTAAHSREIKKYGMFDFMDYENLDDDEFLFFFSNNEKKSKNKKNNTLFGVVSYFDGVFNKKVIDLKTETSRIFAYPAKKGYMMFIEYFIEQNKNPEIRLQKVDID